MIGPSRRLIVLLALLLLAAPARAQDPVEGVWRPLSYHLADGSVLDVDGHIFFEDGAWTVLFFVLDGDGEPVRSSAEGGTYTVDGDELAFRHLYYFAAGAAAGGLPEQPLEMTVRDPEGDAPIEPVRIAVAGDRLTIHFPSGNEMRFRRLP